MSDVHSVYLPFSTNDQELLAPPMGRKQLCLSASGGPRQQAVGR